MSIVDERVADGVSARIPEILFGVGGGIAAAQVPALLIYLRAAGFSARIHIVLTEAAQHLVASQALWGCGADSVHVPGAEYADRPGVAHLELARLADVVVVHPATGDLIGRLAHGLADDLLTTIVLATKAPVVVSPSMNGAMWAKPAVQRNAAQLRADGFAVIEPQRVVATHNAEIGGAVGVGADALLEQIRLALTDAP